MYSSRHILRRNFTTVTLNRNTNQAYDLGKYAVDFIKNGKPSEKVVNRLKLFHTDSVLCGLAALSLKMGSSSLFKNEAFQYMKRGGMQNPRAKLGYSKVFGSNEIAVVEKSIMANISAVSELDATGTIFGYNKNLPGHQAGEVSHNDFYPVVVGAAQQNTGITGENLAKGMILLDEIRGRLCEAYSLKKCNIDPVLNGAIASAITYGALNGATPEHIENAIGIMIAHHLPYRMIRDSKQLTDSRSASAAMTTESAISAIKRAMNGFSGPRDVFRNPRSIFGGLGATESESPFDLMLMKEGSNFSIMSHHFKLGLYVYHAAGAIEGVIKLLKENQFIEHNNPDCIESIKILGYQAAVDVIGGDSKKNPTNRHAAVSSMYYIVATLLKKAISKPDFHQKGPFTTESLWKQLMIEPNDYNAEALKDPITKKIINKITFEHGGKELDAKFPDGLPTIVKIKLTNGKELDSQLIMYPAGHARNTEVNLNELLNHKFSVLGEISTTVNDRTRMVERLENLDELTNAEIQQLYICPIKYADKSFEDSL